MSITSQISNTPLKDVYREQQCRLVEDLRKIYDLPQFEIVGDSYASIALEFLDLFKSFKSLESIKLKIVGDSYASIALEFLDLFKSFQSFKSLESIELSDLKKFDDSDWEFMCLTTTELRESIKSFATPAFFKAIKSTKHPEFRDADTIELAKLNSKKVDDWVMVM
jgi:hypothetical protein